MAEKYCITRDFYGTPVIRYYATEVCLIDYAIPSFEVEIEIKDENIQFKNGKITKKENIKEGERYS